jgi:hypothetical protein
LGAFLTASALAAAAVGIPTYGWLGILPVLGVIIAACGVWIAWQQKRIADVHLRHEQYDRKYRVYGSAKGLLVGLQADGQTNGYEARHEWPGSTGPGSAATRSPRR